MSVTMYFDGACQICSREAAHYRKKDRWGRLKLVDISARGFDARAHGLDPVQVKRELHVKTDEGRLVVGVDAFAEVWKVLPGMGPLARAARAPGVSQGMKAGYKVFAALRPYLPRRKQDECDDGACAL